MGVEPLELALHLQGEFAGGGDDERERLAGRAEPVGVPQERGDEREPERHRLARPGLGRDEQIPFMRVRLQDGVLHGGGFGVAAFGEGALDARSCSGEGHGASGRLMEEICPSAHPSRG